jgi:hypothetical protein
MLSQITEYPMARPIPSEHPLGDLEAKQPTRSHDQDIRKVSKFHRQE